MLENNLNHRIEENGNNKRFIRKRNPTIGEKIEGFNNELDIIGKNPLNKINRNTENNLTDNSIPNPFKKEIKNNIPKNINPLNNDSPIGNPIIKRNIDRNNRMFLNKEENNLFNNEKRNPNLEKNRDNNFSIKDNGKQQINNIEENLKKDTEELKQQERFFYLGNILTLIFFYTIFVDIYNLFNVNWNSFHNIFIGITNFNPLNIQDLLIAFNVLFLTFLIFLLLIPKTLFKDVRNHIYIYSLKIEIYIKNILNKGIFNFNENRNEIVKIIFLLIINTFIIIFYHISINTIFNYQDNQVGILRTFIYGFLLFGSIVFYNHQFDDIIIKVLKNNLVKNRKGIAKILFTLIFYSIGIIVLIYGIKYIADFIYNFFYAFKILQPLLQKV